MPTLGFSLFSELSSNFFGILTSPNARLYIDIVDAIEREIPARGDAMGRAEILEIIDRVLADGAAFHPEQDEKESEPGIEQHSNLILRRLLETKWLEEEIHSDYRRTIFLEPASQTLLEAFRTIVSQNIASFTGKLRLVCDFLAALRFPHSRMELIWEELKNCLSQVRAGLRELRLIRKQVERYAQRQLKTATITEALDIIYNEFSRLITQQCYRELIHARLPERLREAMEGLALLEQDETALQKLRDDVLRTQQDATQAMPEIIRTIEELSLALGDVEPTADRVDTSTADFARRSRSRIRYIQDVGSSRRQQIRTIFDYVRDHLGESRLADLHEKLELPPLRLAGTGLLGMGSLARRRDRAAEAVRRPVFTPLTDADREESLKDMERNLRNSLRLDRANKFVDRLDLSPGESMSSEDMPIHTEDDDILDVISCLVFASVNGANYRLKTARVTHPDEPVVFDTKASFNIERFELERK